MIGPAQLPFAFILLCLTLYMFANSALWVIELIRGRV
jgi:hypothetical protein